MVHVAAPDLHLGAGEDVVLATGVEAVGDVGAVLGEKHRRIRPAGGFRIDDDRESFEVETHQLGGVIGCTRTLRHDQSHRLAHKTNPVNRERRPRECLRHHLKADASR